MTGFSGEGFDWFSAGRLKEAGLLILFFMRSVLSIQLRCWFTFESFFSNNAGIHKSRRSASDISNINHLPAFPTCEETTGARTFNLALRMDHSWHTAFLCMSWQEFLNAHQILNRMTSWIAWHVRLLANQSTSKMGPQSSILGNKRGQKLWQHNAPTFFGSPIWAWQRM